MTAEQRADFGGLAIIEPDLATGPGPGVIRGHWQPAPSRSVPAPAFSEAGSAVRWGRRRAPEVIYRVEHEVARSHVVVLAGMPVRVFAPVEHESVVWVSAAPDLHSDASQTDEGDDEDVLDWPMVVDVPPAARIAGYGGRVYFAETTPRSALPAAGCQCRWQTTDAKGLTATVELALLANEEDALAWARERAPYVLVSKGPAGWYYESAGAQQIPGVPARPKPDGIPRNAVVTHTWTDGGTTYLDYIAPPGGRQFRIDDVEPLGGFYAARGPEA
ncbi:MAG: hypothetical protein R3C15_22285 [Thermoleophilia bacterium]